MTDTLVPMDEPDFQAQPGLLVIDDDVAFARALAFLATDAGFRVSIAGTLREAKARVQRERFALAVIDLKLPDGSGLSLFEWPELQASRCVLLTGVTNVEMSVRSSRAYIPEVLTKPVPIDKLRQLLTDARHSHAAPSHHVDDFHGFLVAGEAHRRLADEAARVARQPLNVLVLGEPGTGKKTLARALHTASGRDGPCVVIDCDRFADDASQHEVREEDQPRSWLAQAARGTLVLDHVEALSKRMQAQLMAGLGATGSEGPRLISVCHRPDDWLHSDLRANLRHRLGERPMSMPPLRGQPEQIAALAQAHLDRLNKAHGACKQLTEGALEALLHRPWPGNAHELHATLARAFHEAGTTIDAPLPAVEALVTETSTSLMVPIGMPLHEVEQRLLHKALLHFGGDKVKAADALGISVKTIYNRLAKGEASAPGEGPERAIPQAD